MAEFTSRGQGNLNTVLGTVGTVGALGGMLGGCNGGILGNLWGGSRGCCEGDQLVNRYENSLLMQMVAKDSENALLRSQVYTDGKLVEIVKDYTSQINNLAAEVRANKDEQGQINLQQAVYNGTNTATIGCIQQQIAALQSLTKLVVPNTSVCPGWGNVTITPAAAATTTPAA